LTGAAAARLYDDHVDAVHALITRRVGPDESGDIVGEAFEHALRSWDRFDQERGTERLFLFGAAIAVLRRHGETERAHLTTLGMRGDYHSAVTVVDPLVDGGRGRSPRVVSHTANEDLLGETDAADTPDGSPLMVAISELPPDDRDILLLSLWEAVPQAAIAEALDLSVGAVRSALGRIRRELKVATTTTAKTKSRTKSKTKSKRRS